MFQLIASLLVLWAKVVYKIISAIFRANTIKTDQIVTFLFKLRVCIDPMQSKKYIL